MLTPKMHTEIGRHRPNLFRLLHVGIASDPIRWLCRRNLLSDSLVASVIRVTVHLKHLDRLLLCLENIRLYPTSQ